MARRVQAEREDATPRRLIPDQTGLLHRQPCDCARRASHDHTLGVEPALDRQGTLEGLVCVELYLDPPTGGDLLDGRPFGPDGIGPSNGSGQ